MKRKNLFRMVYTALFAALIFIGTFVFKIPTPIGGYVHLGDGFIFIASAILPAPYAIAAAIVGAGISDLIFAPGWLLATVLIKGLCAACFTSKKNKFFCLRNMIALSLSLVITVAGYYLAGALICGNFITPIVDIPMNILQILAGALLFFAFGVAFDRAKGLREAVFGRIL